MKNRARKATDSPPKKTKPKVKETFMIYAIIRQHHNQKLYIERFTEEKWANLPLYFVEDTTKIPYFTKDITDPELLKVKEIIWDRLYNPKQRAKVKIVVPFTPDNIPLMAERAEEIIAEKEKLYRQIEMREQEAQAQKAERLRPKLEAQLKLHDENVAKYSELIPDDMEMFAAMKKWRDLNFIAPPPRRILEIKKTMNLSWEHFRQLCYEMR